MMALPASSWSGPRAATAAAATSGVTVCFSRCAPVRLQRGGSCSMARRSSGAAQGAYGTVSLVGGQAGQQRSGEWIIISTDARWWRRRCRAGW